MTTPRTTLSDALLKEALSRRTDGPTVTVELIDEVSLAIKSTTQSRGWSFGLSPLGRPASITSPLGLRTSAWPILVVGAVLLALVVASIAGQQPSRPGSWSPVVVQRNGSGLEEPPRVHTYAGGGQPNAGGGQPSANPLVEALEPQSMFLAWSPDGEHMASVVGDQPGGSGGYEGDRLRISGADGSNAILAAPPEPAPGDDPHRYNDRYQEPGAGPVWSPDSRRVAVAWTKGACTFDPRGGHCLPAGGIDVFSVDGNHIVSFDTPDTELRRPIWSPDSQRVGWVYGYEFGQRAQYVESAAVGFATRGLGQADDAQQLELARGTVVSAWTSDDRLLLVNFGMIFASGYWASPESIFQPSTVKADGRDRRSVPGSPMFCEYPCTPGGPHGGYSLGYAWSPNGRYFAYTRSWTSIVIRDAETGTDTIVRVPSVANRMIWSPDEQQLLGLTYDEDGTGRCVAPRTPCTYTGTYVVDSDGSNLRKLGSADEVAWRYLP